jgi:microsomal dipeptidase-like Zn-dependent dipeptidase
MADLDRSSGGTRIRAVNADCRAALARRGFTADDVARVMGGNSLRFLRANLG